MSKLLELIAERNVASASTWRDVFGHALSRCAADRFAYFPEVLRKPIDRRVLIWGVRPSEDSLGVHGAAVDSAFSRNPGLERGGIVGFHPTPPPALASAPYSSYADYFMWHPTGSNDLIVDRSCTWRDRTPDWERLTELGAHVVRFEQFLNAPALSLDGYYRGHSDEVLRSAARMLEFVDRFADEKSRCVYLQALTAFVTMDYSAFHANLNPNPHRYIPDDIGRPLRDDEIFVDCGAFDGTDTIWFLERVDRHARAVHVFEPEFGNYRATVRNLTAYARVNGIDFIVPYAMGVGAESGYFKFTGTGQGVVLAEPSSSNRGGLFVARLDDLIDDATWIKLEVEGFELPALRGSMDLIRRARPTVSISVYHLPTDFLDIVPFVISEIDDYALYLRHSGLEPGTLCLTAVPT